MPRTLLLAAIACACGPGAAWGAATPPSDGDLSARLAELAKPAVRAASPAQQAKALSVARDGPGSLVREGNRVLVEVRFERGAAAGVADLRATGARIVDLSRRYQTVTVAMRPDQLQRLSGVPRVVDAGEVLTPLVHEAETSEPVTAAKVPCYGAATSEGDMQLRAAHARAEFEVDGDGVKVGVLSDSFNRDTAAATNAATDVATGDLPGPGNPCGRGTPVEILSDSVAGSDEGRGMAQIVHDLSPGADLSFATAFTGLTAFANNIKALASAGASVITDDVSYFEEPFFQEGPVGVAVSEVTEGGASYFSSAGNNNLISGSNNIASWETPEFRDSATCPAALVAVSEDVEAEFGPGAGLNPSHCLDFDPGGGVDTTFRITVSNGATLSAALQWAEPWAGVDSDIDAFLFDSGGNLLAESIDDNSSAGGTQRPFEFIAWENNTGGSAQVQLVINRYDGESPRLKFALLQNGGGVTSTEYPQGLEGDVVGPTIFGHNGAADAMSLAAIPYFRDNEPERFSSQGPVTHYFGPVNGGTPASALPSAEVLAKPDVVATDGGANSFFGACSLGVWRFYGTSAAAPHAAAVAALERDAEPAATADEIAEAQRESAAAVGAFPPEAVGAGLISATAAIEALGVSPTAPGATPAEPPAPVSCLGAEPEPEPEPQPEPTPTPSPTPEDGTSSAIQADRTAPRTFFRRRPAKVVRTRGRRGKAVFRFGANEQAVSFLCQFDRKRYRRCGIRFVRWFLHGRHVLRVKARDMAGNVDPTPAVYRFRVKRGKPTRGGSG